MNGGERDGACRSRRVFKPFRGSPHPLLPLIQSDWSLCSARMRCTVARLTPSAVAIVLAGSPDACIRCARPAFDASSFLGRPMDWPRARRASRAAARRSRPSSNSSSARLARTPATIRPVALDVSMPSYPAAKARQLRTKGIAAIDIAKMGPPAPPYTGISRRTLPRPLSGPGCGIPRPAG
jgi:hypothetical protein